jgi:signal transduction histidine kinase
VGFDGGGLYHLDTSRLKFRPYGPDKGVHAKWITTVHVDRDKNTWVGSNDGLYLYNRKSDRFEFIDMASLGDSGTQPFILDIAQDQDGILWLATTIYGVVRFDPVTRAYLSIRKDPQNRNSLPHEMVYDILPGDNHVLYLATRGGLSRFDVKSFHFTNLRREEGLPNNTVFALAIKDRRLWAATEGGLVNTSLTLDDLRLTGTGQGLFASLRAYGGFLHHRNHLWIGHNGGVIAVPDNLLKPRRTEPPKPVIDGIFYQGSNLLHSYHSPLTHPHSTLLEIPYRLRDLDVHLSAPSLTRKDQVALQYRLLGLSDTWRTVRRNFEEAHYANLPPGRYTLQVRAGLQDVWGPVYTPALVLVERAPWWNPVAWTIYGILIVSLWWWLRQRQQQRLQELEHLSRRLRAADKAKDELLRNVSHELKTPLNGILGLTQLMHDGLMGNLPEEARQACEDILNAGHRLNLLVSNLLSLSQLRAGDIAVRYQQVRVLDILQRIERILRRELPFKDKVRMRFRVPEDLEIRTDPLLFEQIMTNLLHNALKFTEDGVVDVAVEPVENQWLVSVTDNGIGMDPDIQEAIVAPFRQGDSSMTRRYGGLGLGLTICKSLLHLLNARLWVSSQPGEGTSISFYLSANPKAAD